LLKGFSFAGIATVQIAFNSKIALPNFIYNIYSHKLVSIADYVN